MQFINHGNEGALVRLVKDDATTSLDRWPGPHQSGEVIRWGPMVFHYDATMPDGEVVYSTR